jgi:hypothetical protein
LTPVVADAGTDCALGEVFNLEAPPGLDSVQLEVHAKHTLTGDEHIGTAAIPLDALKVGLGAWGLVAGLQLTGGQMQW